MPARSTHGSHGRADRRQTSALLKPLLVLVAVAAFSVVLRLPFLHVPLTADEGGYSYIAYFWERGETLYRDMWVDRPQLLVLTFQYVQQFLGTSPADLRLAAALYNALTTLAVAAVVWRMYGSRWAVAAAFTFAWFSAAPYVEGFTLNGELLLILPSTLSMLCIVHALSSRSAARNRDLGSHWLWVGAGVFGGVSFLMKQAGIDALLAGGAVLTVLAVVRSAPVTDAATRIAALVGGALIPVGASVAHGVATAGYDYLFAVFLYRMQVDSPLHDDPLEQWRLFRNSIDQVSWELGPLFVLALIGVVSIIRRGSRVERTTVVWLGAALFAVVMGAQYHPHYYIACVPALVVCAVRGTRALASALRSAGRVRTVARVAYVVLGVWFAAAVGYDVALMRADDPDAVSWEVFAEPRYLQSDEVGAYLRARTHPDERIFAMYAGADLYFHARRKSAYRYVWFRGLSLIPGAYENMRAILRDPVRHPAYIAYMQHPDTIDPTGSLDRLVRRFYDPVSLIEGVRIWQANESAFARLRSIRRGERVTVSVRQATGARSPRGLLQSGPAVR